MSQFPTFGLIQIVTGDPNSGAGTPGLPNEFLIRTDGTPTLYFLPQGASPTGWVKLGMAGGVGTDPNTESVLFDDFIGIGFSTLGVNGGGSNSLGAVLPASNPGTYTQTVTAAGVDCARITFGGNSLYFGGGQVDFKTLHRIPTLSDGVNNIVSRDGYGDSTTVADHVDGVYFEYDLATHGDQNYRLCTSLNSVRTKVDTGIAAVANTNRLLHITINPLGTLVSGSIDGVACANTINTNIPITTARATHIQLQSVKQLGAGALTMIRDFWWHRQQLSPAR